MSIVLPSLYYFILRAIELIGYYKTKGYSFYTDATTVINTVEFGYRAEQQDRDVENFDDTAQESASIVATDDDDISAESIEGESVEADTIDNNQDRNLDE